RPESVDARLTASGTVRQFRCQDLAVAIGLVIGLFCAAPTQAQSFDAAAGVLLPSVSQQEQKDPNKPVQPGQPVSDPDQSRKETRGFFGALSHNLLDDLKHMPRRNSVYWLAAGSVGALAVHPFDDEINQRLVGSDFADKFFIPGKVLGATEF